MKKFVLFLLFANCFSNLFASHLMGGDVIIKYNQDAGGYLVKLTYIRDVNGANLTPTINYSVYNQVAGSWTLFQYNKAYFDSTLSAINSVDYPSSVEVKIYVDTVAASLFETNLCCRSGFIVNLNNPSTYGVELFTNLEVDSLHNSSPDFLLNQPIVVPLNQVTSFTTYPYDIDGDLLSTEFSPPLEVSTSPSAPNVIPGTQIFQTNPYPYGPIDINSYTAQITWKPSTLGTFVHSSTISEFRNKRKIGSLIRDYQYIVVDMPDSHAPTIQGVSPYNVNGNINYVSYTPGQPLTFLVQGNDVDNNYPLTLRCISSLFSGANQPVFTSNADSSIANGTFQWTPASTYTKDELLVFRVKDSIFSNDFVLMLKNIADGIQTLPSTPSCSLSFSPNPVHQHLSIRLDVSNDLQHGSIDIYALTGQKIMSVYEGKISEGNFSVGTELNIAQGIYFLTVANENGIIRTEEMIVE
jgi:hypothetical protein